MFRGVLNAAIPWALKEEGGQRILADCRAAAETPEAAPWLITGRLLLGQIVTAPGRVLTVLLHEDSQEALSLRTIWVLLVLITRRVFIGGEPLIGLHPEVESPILRIGVGL